MRRLLRILLVTPILLLGAPASAEEHEHSHASEKDPHDHAAKADHAHEKDAHDHHAHEGHVDEVKLTAEAIQRHGVKVAPATKQVIRSTISVPARVMFNTEAMAHVGSAVHGRAAEIKVRVGDRVKKGDELLVIESPELGEAQSDFIQKRTAVAVAESTIEPARQAADRGRKLFDQSQGIALGEVQKREAEAKAAEGALKTAQAAATAAENKLHLMGMDQAAVETLAKGSEINPRCVVRAPLDGQVIEREITLGELVSPDKEALMVLADLGTLWAVADVPEARLREIVADSPARVRIAAVSDDAVTGKVSFIAPSLDPNTRTAQVRIELPNSDGRLKPGMFATAEISSAAPANNQAVLAISEEAVQTVEGGPAVFVPVEGEANTFAKRAVTVGKAVGGIVPVLSGLKEGESVVVSGAFILKADLGKGSAAHEH